MSVSAASSRELQQRELMGSDLLPEARRVLREEARALLALSERLDERFSEATSWIHNCQGNVMTCGIGKAGWIAQKVAATLASLGVSSQFLHPAEAVHGDLGRVRTHDLVLAFSYSGETEEVNRLLPMFESRGIPVIAVTRSSRSTLGSAANCTIELGTIEEACPLGLAPTATTAAMLAIGDALAIVCSGRQGFAADDFAVFHPGGSLGRRLSVAEDAMRPLTECRVARAEDSVRQSLISQHRPGRRSGAILVMDAEGVLAGLFTDSDLARLLERQDNQALDALLGQVMTQSPLAVGAKTRIADVLQMLEDHRISELPVLDERRRPLGMIDLTDLVGTAAGQPAEHAVKSPRSAPGSPAADASPPCILPFPNPSATDSVDEA